MWKMIKPLAIQLSEIDAACFWKIYAPYIKKWQHFGKIEDLNSLL
jgi:hypothetical protein